MKKIIITTVFLSTLIILIILTIFGQRGFIHMVRLKDDLVAIEKKNIQLHQENESLKKEVELLKNDLKYLEEIARKELGLIKDGELVYRLGESKK
jgi:cell division protein FtsB